jgi:hypothetical protein
MARSRRRRCLLERSEQSAMPRLRLARVARSRSTRRRKLGAHLRDFTLALSVRSIQRRRKPRFRCRCGLVQGTARCGRLARGGGGGGGDFTSERRHIETQRRTHL